MGIYHLYGLLLESEISLPQLINGTVPNGVTPDVSIQIGTVPDDLPDLLGKSVLYQINHHQLRYALPDIARFLVSNGREIIVQPETSVDLATIQLFLLGPIFGALFHQRRTLPMRGSCIETPQGAVIFVGDSNVGKSTLAAAFTQRGYRILSDDISIIQLDEVGGMQVVPGFPQLQLWAETLEMLSYEPRDGWQPVRPQLGKYWIPASFRDQPLHLHAIYNLNPLIRSDLTISSLSPKDKMLLINRFIYYMRFAVEMDILKYYWSTCATIATSTMIKQINRERNKNTIQAMVEVLIKDWT